MSTNSRNYFTFGILNMHHIRYSNEPHTLYDETDIVKEIKKVE